MSDNGTPDKVEYVSPELTHEDLDKLVTEQFQSQGYIGRTYTAPPAKGSNTKGIWHNFPAHGRSGYATHAIALHRMLLDHLKIPTALIPHHHENIDIDKFPSDRSEMLTKWLVDAVGIPELLIVSLPPDLAMYDTCRALVNYVAGPECTQVSPYAANLVNQEGADEPRLTALWCVSPFTARAYVRGGTKADKVFVVRPPICDGVWRNMFSSLDQISPTRDQAKPFVIGAMGTWHERKGFLDLIRAYFRSFKRTENVELHIRTSSMEPHETIKMFDARVIADIAKIAKEEFGDDSYPLSRKQPKIKLLTGTGLSEQEVISWIGSLDALANPSYGEGLGIPQMWAYAQGIPVVTSDFGAVGEFASRFDSSWCRPFDSKPVRVPASMRAHSPIWGSKSEWGGYNVDALAERLREVASGESPRSRDVAAFTRGHFSYGMCADGALDALDAVCRPEVVAEWARGPA